MFRFNHDGIKVMVTFLSWSLQKLRTSTSRYSVTPLLATCIILRRLCTPCRWSDLEMTFFKHASQLSEIFWDGIVSFVDDRKLLLSGPIPSSYISPKAADMALAIQQVTNALPNCIGFVDGSLYQISRPGGPNLLQNVCYNGHKRHHGIKFQAVVTPDGMIVHFAGPMEGRRHDWALYLASGIDESLSNGLLIDGVQYCIFGDAAYDERPYLYTPAQGGDLSDAQKAFNRAMSRARVTVEWSFRKMKSLWAVLDFHRKLKIRESPVSYIVYAVALLHNAHNCLHRNEVSRFFNCPPPSFREYLEQRID